MISFDASASWKMDNLLSMVEKVRARYNAILLFKKDLVRHNQGSSLFQLQTSRVLFVTLR